MKKLMYVATIVAITGLMLGPSSMLQSAYAGGGGGVGGSGGVTGTVSIDATCGIVITDLADAAITGLDYGNLDFGETSNDAVPAVKVLNSGTSSAALELEGTSWTEVLTPANVQLNPGDTHWSITAADDYTTTDLVVAVGTGTPGNQVTATLGAQTFIPLHFQVEANLQSLPFSGDIEQDLTFTTVC